MREGDYPINQSHPTVMSMFIRKLLIGCNWYLLDLSGAVGGLLHR